MHAIVKLMIGYQKVHSLKQKELAVVIGATESQVSKWLAGRHNPCRAWQKIIVDRLGLSSNTAIGKMERLSHVEEVESTSAC